MKKIAKSWLSWTKIESPDFEVDWDTQLNCLIWSIALVAFGFLVLAFDTRHLDPRRRSGHNIRDRIAGLEQRYFLVIFNGFLLYIALTMMSQKPHFKQEGVSPI